MQRWMKRRTQTRQEQQRIQELLELLSQITLHQWQHQMSLHQRR